MKTRVITGAFLMAVLVPAIYFAGIYFLIVGIFLSVVASYEMMNVFYTKGPSLKKVRFLVPVLSGILVLLIYFAANSMQNGQTLENMIYHFWVVTFFVAAIILCLGIMIFTKGSTAHDMMACIMTLVYCGLIMGFVISIAYISPIGTSSIINNKVLGGRSFAYLMTIVVFTDTFAYLIGVKFGKHKLAPEISPKKSVEGAIGGLVAGALVGVICVFLFKIITFSDNADLMTKILIIFMVFMLSLILSVAVQVGDLIASKIKRSYGIKDFGKIFPGHGGVLDRFDSFIFAGAVYYVIVQFIQLVLLGTN